MIPEYKWPHELWGVRPVPDLVFSAGNSAIAIIMVLLMGRGEYQIAKVTKAGPRTLGKGSASAITESTVSVLELICLSGGPSGSVTISLRVNGEPVGTHMDTLQPLLGSGGVGIMAETGEPSQDPFADSAKNPSLEVAFEDFMVWTR